MEKCPKCKGKQGYKEEYVVSYIQEMMWEGEPIQSEQTGRNNRVYRVIECLDCGKRFNRKILEREIE
jgi:hypothetical protein